MLIFLAYVCSGSKYERQMNRFENSITIFNSTLCFKESKNIDSKEGTIKFGLTHKDEMMSCHLNRNVFINRLHVE